MKIVQRTRDLVSAALKSYGPSNIKKILWDKEFSGGKWNFIDNTEGDCVYAHLEKFARGGNILDLGCGPGNTANEVAESAYRSYVGVDISEAALDKGTRRSEQTGRRDKNRFVCGDFINYVPAEKFDVILFRESMYHVPLGKVKATLDRYSRYVKDGGVFIVRLRTPDGTRSKEKHRPKAMVGIIESEFEVVEKGLYEEAESTVIVFRPSHRG